jgi:hypothetical protein
MCIQYAMAESKNRSRKNCEEYYKIISLKAKMIAHVMPEVVKALKVVRRPPIDMRVWRGYGGGGFMV